MVYSVAGEVRHKSTNFAVIEVGGLGLKILMSKRTLTSLPAVGGNAKIFNHLHVREDALELYGFPSEAELNLFEMLISVSGVGPKSALGILDIAELRELTAAIKAGRPDLLTRASGIGSKTAERIVLELKTKVAGGDPADSVQKMESDADLLETLVSLGYRRETAKTALQKVEASVIKLEDRLKEALKILNKK